MLAFTVLATWIWSFPLLKLSFHWPARRAFPMLADWLLEELMLDELAALEEFALLEELWGGSLCSAGIESLR